MKEVWQKYNSKCKESATKALALLTKISMSVSVTMSIAISKQHEHEPEPGHRHTVFERQIFLLSRMSDTLILVQSDIGIRHKCRYRV